MFDNILERGNSEPHAIWTKALCLLAAVLVLLSISCLLEEVQAAEQLTLDLTPEERAFLVEHPILKLGVGVAFPPFQYVEEEDGRRLFKGMVADTVLLLEQRLGVRMVPVWDVTFAQALDMGKAGAIDIFPCIAWTPERAEFLAFTRPYLSYPLVIVSRDDTTFIGSVEELHGRKVAEVKALATYSKFINELPHLAIDFVFEKDTQAMLEAVSFGRAEACVVDLAVASYVINKRGLSNLKVAAPTRWDETRLAMAVPKDRAILAKILQKALDSLTFNEKDALRQRWIGLNISPLMSPILFRRILLQGGGAALLVVAVILWWNRRLRLEMAERKRAEDALRESEEQFDLFMTHCPIYVFFKDENIKTLRLSRNYEQMLGRPLKDLMGKSMSELFPPQLAQSMVDDDMRVLREGAPVTVVECFNDRIYTTTKFPIKRKGKPLLIAGFTIDITERNRNEELRRQVETIIQHDLRTPAGFAVSLASALRGDINLTDQQRYLLERMEHAGLEMLDTLSRSLTLFKIETSQYQCVLKSLDCLPLVKELARNMSLRPQFESIGLEIVMDGQPLPSDAVYPCICEAELLRPALNNILENALQASPPGSGVRVNLASGQDCCIEIRNNGTVPMEIRDRFFDKYVTHGKFKGTGIGTYSAKMMIEAQGGSIEMRTSDEKNETTVTIFIPAQTRLAAGMVGEIPSTRNRS